MMEAVFELLSLANDLEGTSRIEAATKYYEGVYLMKQYLERIPIVPSELATRKLLQEKIRHYEKVAAGLMAEEQTNSSVNKGGGRSRGISVVVNPRSPIDKETFFNHDSSVVPIQPPVPPPPPPQNPPSSPNHPRSANSSVINSLVSQANVKLSSALDFDEAGQTSKAISSYMEAAEMYLKGLRATEKLDASVQVNSVADLLKKRLESTMDRVEVLKNPPESTTKRAIVPQHRVADPKREGGTLMSGGFMSGESSTSSSSSSQSPSKSSLTATEISILKRSSLIASGMFLPWSDDDVVELLAQAQNSKAMFVDPDGSLPLSPKQEKRFDRWARPSEIVRIRQRKGMTARLQDVVMVRTITPYTIKQQYVTDCSFIAGLCICSAYERRFQKKLITSILHPQNKNGSLVCNPSGKYMVKLWLNGVARSVVVDDRLPIDRHGNLLCSHTTGTTVSQLELWVCIIEKAYMKLCGGYDFPGSNSGVDLFSLTGWIPERIHFAKDPNSADDHETPPERAWERILSASSYGDCLITVSTHLEMAEKDADAIGLVLGHAYAVLSVISTKNGTRLLQLKNPWAQKGWKGRYSSSDLESWKDPAFRADVGYDPSLAKEDDGVFWICWEDILNYFRNFHLSWNPSLFSFRLTMHGSWPKDQGPIEDTFNIGENPQYVLTFSDAAVQRNAAIWVLISRHVTKQEQEGMEAQDFLTVHIHRNNQKQQRMWYPGRGGNCILTGAYTNNPHVLVRYDLTGPEDKHLSLVLSQYKRSNDLAYTLSCYCTESFSLGKPEKDLEHSIQFSSEWTKETAGGPIGRKTFWNNPMFAVSVPRGGCVVQFRISTARSIAVHALMVPVESYGDVAHRGIDEAVVDSGKYKHCFLVTQKTHVPAGSYALVLSNYHGGEAGAFHLVSSSSKSLHMKRVR